MLDTVDNYTSVIARTLLIGKERKVPKSRSVLSSSETLAMVTRYRLIPR